MAIVVTQVVQSVSWIGYHQLITGRLLGAYLEGARTPPKLDKQA